jgi:hypothetical protein
LRSIAVVPEHELGAVFGVPTRECRVEPLSHNPRNAVTVGIWHVRAGAQSAVLKVLTRRGSPAADAPEWAASDQPPHWNYWEREARAYSASELRELLRGTGLAMPALLARFDRADDEIALWLEDVDGCGGGRVAALGSPRRSAGPGSLPGAHDRPAVPCAVAQLPFPARLHALEASRLRASRGRRHVGGSARR